MIQAKPSKFEKTSKGYYLKDIARMLLEGLPSDALDTGYGCRCLIVGDQNKNEPFMITEIEQEKERKHLRHIHMRGKVIAEVDYHMWPDVYWHFLKDNAIPYGKDWTDDNAEMADVVNGVLEFINAPFRYKTNCLSVIVDSSYDKRYKPYLGSSSITLQTDIKNTHKTYMTWLPPALHESETLNVLMKQPRSKAWIHTSYD